MHEAWGDRSQLIACVRAIAQDYDSQDRSRCIIFPTRSMEGTVLIAVVGGLFLACLIFYGLAAARKRKLRSVVQVYKLCSRVKYHYYTGLIVLYLKL